MEPNRVRVLAARVAQVACAFVVCHALSTGARAQVACPGAEEFEVLDRINLERATAGLGPVTMDSRLVDSARRHSADMESGCFLSHIGSDGSTAASRMLDAGYPSPNNEAAGAGQTDPQRIVNDWMASSAHRSILLNPNSVHVGISRAVGPQLCMVAPYDLLIQPYWWNADFGTAGVPPEPVCANGDNAPPNVAIASPNSGDTVSGIISLTVAASDDVGIAAVMLTVDGVELSADDAAPYEFSWDTSGSPDGLYAIQAVAMDTEGATGASEVIELSVANTAAPVDLVPPTVSITSPPNSSTVSRTVQIHVQASDDMGLARIDVALDDLPLGSISCAEATCLGSVSWNSRKAAAGAHTLSAQAWDLSGSASPIVSIGVWKAKGGSGKGRGNR